MFAHLAMCHLSVCPAVCFQRVSSRTDTAKWCLSFELLLLYSRPPPQCLEHLTDIHTVEYLFWAMSYDLHFTARNHRTCLDIRSIYFTLCWLHTICMGKSCTYNLWLWNLRLATIVMLCGYAGAKKQNIKQFRLLFSWGLYLRITNTSTQP